MTIQSARFSFLAATQVQMKDESTNSDEASSERDNPGFWTIPNGLCIGRFIGSFALLPLAWAGLSSLFVGVYLVLITSDLVDRPIARRFKRRTDVGAHLDSIADATLNACLLAGVSILCWNLLQSELILVGAVVLSYCLSIAFGFWKYGRFLSYHTYLAKFTQWLAMFAAVSLVLDWSVWQLRVAAIAAILGNLEAIAITAVSTRLQTDVATLFRVWPTK